MTSKTAITRAGQEQHWYFCYTCGLVESEGCCSVCVKVCHKDHDVAYARHGNFFCDCGAARSAQVCVADAGEVNIMSDDAVCSWARNCVLGHSGTCLFHHMLAS